jgi:hypothetical protein
MAKARPASAAKKPKKRSARAHPPEEHPAGVVADAVPETTRESDAAIREGKADIGSIVWRHR